MSRKETLTIIGCGGHSKVVSEIAALNGYLNIDYLDTVSNRMKFLGRSVRNSVPHGYSGSFFTAIGDNYSRQAVTESFLEQNPQAKLITLIHPNAVVSEQTKIGEGVVIMPNCAINSSTTVKDGVIINTGSCIDHDCILFPYASVGPGVAIGGSVVIGQRSAIGIGACIKNQINIGSDSVIGAGAVVLNNIAANIVAYGIPAKNIRNRDKNDFYL